MNADDPSTVVDLAPRGGELRCGVVVIGRNEGERLRACLVSLRPWLAVTIYVDSDSTDGSAELAESFGAVVRRLDPARSFTAARARHEGAIELLSRRPGLEILCFVDGDCEVDPVWIRVASQALAANPHWGAVAGRRREKHPRASWYNLQCDDEWDAPAGRVTALGGDAVYRAAAYLQAGGFDATVSAGEEPELSKRLRDAGWELARLDAEMTRHDAAILTFGAWAKRQVRTGYGGADVERRFRLGIFRRLIRGAWFWSVLYPLGAAIAALLAARLLGRTAGAATLVASLGGLLLQTARITRQMQRRGHGLADAAKLALLTMLAKPAIAWGAARSWRDARAGRRQKLIEYKAAAETPTLPSPRNAALL